ncbi:alkaline shock response membrane anchor protein AmaP [Alkalicoccobacillus murimartini]|uniref:alkaline shock response membrane anchor protein AmaP n=1 Tax=Alkalicoccobacillus murimartini TaxID=171685 RepID=UPI0027D81C09|nr:alkaline shock response membrane anchor protein AmaP [Alkalicoccobacillus murimartini]
MNVAIRIIVGIYAFLTLLILGSVLLDVTGIYQPINELLAIQQTNEMYWILIGILSFVFVVSLILFLSSFKKRERTQSKFQSPTDIGVIGISKDSIESTVLRIIRRFEGVRSVDVDSSISKKTQQVTVSVSYAPFGPNPVQENAKKLQESVKMELEKWLEIPVKEVKVLVKNQSNPTKKRERVI